MKERLQQKSNSQNQQLPHLFTKKGKRNISRIKSNKAQLVLGLLSSELDEKDTPLIHINTKKFIESLIMEHIEYARFEEEYTRTKIQNAVRDVTKRIQAQEKQKKSEIDLTWSYYNNLLKKIIFFIDSISRISDSGRVSTTLDSDNELEIQDEYARSRGIYNGWMDRIFAGVDLEKMKRVLDDNMQDNTPHPNIHKT